jgi:hypothetical protein
MSDLPATPSRRHRLDECRLIELPTVHDRRGNLTFVEGGRHLPFDIARSYWVYDVPGGSERGGHAHRRLEQFIVAVAGSFDVVVDDGRERRRFTLNRCFFGLYLCPMMWRELDNFSSGAVCMVLASRPYEESDYIRDPSEFARLAGPAP